MKTERQQVQQAYLAFLNEHAVFTLEELAGVAGGESPRRTARERVKYYVETGRLLPVSRELYAVVPQGVVRETFTPDPFLVAATLRRDAVFSHHSALELLGAGHSDWNVCTAGTSERPTTLSWGSRTLKMLRAPVAVFGEGWRSVGVREVTYRGHTLHTTGPERTLVEGFRQPRWVGGLAELVESAAGFESLDLDLLRKVLAAYDQRSLWAAVGWFLERHASAFYASEADLAEFAAHRPKSKHYLPRGMRGGVFVSRWNLMLPPELVRGGEFNEPLA